MKRLANLRRVDHSWQYAAAGFLLGILAPLGWVVVRLLFFRPAGGSLPALVWDDVIRSGEHFALYLYMGGGTALVLAVFGFLLGKGVQQLHDRARSLDALNRTVAQQKEEFEQRFRDLNHSIKNFHAINTHIQKSVDLREVLRLAADGLHDILGYDRVNILMVNRDRNTLEFVTSRGSGNDAVDGIAIPLDERAGALYKTVRENRLFLVDDITRMPAEFHLRPPCDAVVQLRSRSFIICPIVVRDEVVGLFGVDNKLKRKALDDTDVDTVKLFADQVSSTLTKLSLLQAVETLTRELEHTFAELLKYREDHARLDRALKQATASTGVAIGEIAGAADVVREAVDATRSAVGQISVSIEQVSHNIAQLADFMEKSIAAMTEISATIRSVEENAARSNGVAETVRSQAQDGAALVEGTVGGLRGIAEAVDEASSAIGSLAEKSARIDSITEAINGITQKTNLLALNAAIIAAQAGEHGRSFAVVADEVRSLSLEAADSTGAIARIVDEIRECTRQTVDQIGRTRQLVADGIGRGEGMEQSLRQILESATASMAMTHEIRKATREVAHSVETVTRSIEELGEMSAHVSLASREQAAGTRSIVASVEQVKGMVEEMVAATDEQRRNTSNIESAVDLVSDMAKRIFDEMEERKQGSREVIERLERLKRVGTG
jgi:methyl-accepting chemotaxis protein